MDTSSNAAANKKGFTRWRFILLSFHDRIDRETYWLGTVVLYFVVFIAALVGTLFLSFTQLGGSDAGSYAGLVVGGLFLVAGMVLGLVGGVAIAVKRLHDFNWSGWWVLPYYLLPFLTLPHFVPPAVQVLASLVSLLVLITLGAVRGTIGPNSYGPDPHWRAHLR